MKDRKYFCYEIFKNLAIRSINGQLIYGPCSYYTDKYCSTDDLDIQSVWNGSERKKVIDLVNQDQPIAGCQCCYDEESHGIRSRRQGSQIAYEEYHCNDNIDLSSPQALDYCVGNLCNLKCVICSPMNSTQWIPDFQKLYPHRKIDFLKYQKNNQEEIVDDKSLENIISLHFHGGGEPLMTDAHVRLLERIRRVKGLQDVRVFYNTNGTVKPDDSVLKLWEECRLIELYFSIDDIGHRFNYQRTGANWDELTANLNWFTEHMPHNHMFNVNCAWGYLNLYYLDELVDWYQSNFAQSRYGDPINLIFQRVLHDYRIEHISAQVRDVLLRKFDNYPTLIPLVQALTISDEPHNKFWQHINALDQIRNSNFRDHHLQWAQLLT